MNLNDHLRAAARHAPASGIVAVANHARGRPGVIPLWVGEGDMPTPAFISDAAIRSLNDGETFYTWQLGIPELRQALGRYFERHFPGHHPAETFVVCGGGMQAIQLAVQATAGAGDEALFLAPAWPNFAGALAVAGATPVPVPLDLTGNGWACDIDRLGAAITPRTRVIFVNSPSNPTGWTADIETLRSILALARRHGLWIIADEIYSLFHYAGGRAPSFLDIMDPDDRILFVNSFSKNWAMTGWRIGWLRINPQLQPVFENLVQYSTSGVAPFMQRGAVAALDGGDGFIGQQVERAQKARDLVCGILRRTGRVQFDVPQGAFYLFFAIDGVTDSHAAALEIVDRCMVGLAPGAAFGADGEGYFRLCFHRSLDRIEEAANRLAGWISAR